MHIVGRMELENILLGLLREPASGYDLKRAFDTSINYFWHADIAQVYRTLGRMEDKGLLKSKELPSEQGPPRKVYRRTAAGNKQFQAWLHDEPTIVGQRYSYVAQLVFLGQLDDLDETERFLSQIRDAFISRLAVLKHIEACELEEDLDRLSSREFHSYLGLQMGIQVMESRVAWCDQTLKVIRRRRKRIGDNG